MCKIKCKLFLLEGMYHVSFYVFIMGCHVSVMYHLYMRYCTHIDISQALPSVVTQAASFNSDVSTRVRALNMLTGLSNANWDGSDTYSSDAQTQPITNLPNLPNSESNGSYVGCCIIVHVELSFSCHMSHVTSHMYHIIYH